MGAFLYLTASISARAASFGAAVALPVLAIQQFNDVAIGGLLVAASLGPSVLAAPLAGVILDRSGRPELVIAGAGLVTAAALTTAAFLGPIPLPAVLVTLITAGALTPFYNGGLSSFVVSVILNPRKAFAYDALSYNASAVAGPALVALVILFFPVRSALFVLASSAALGAACVASLSLSPHAPFDGSPLKAVKDGLQRIFRHRPLAVVTASYTLTQIGQGALAVSALALSLERAGSPGQGSVLVTLFACGSLLGSILETSWPQRHRAHLVMIASFLATGLLTLAAVLDLGTPWTGITIGLSGIFTAPATAAMLFLRNRHSPAYLRSQIFTVSAGLNGTASALGAVLAASFSDIAGGVVSVGVIGLIWIASAAIMVPYPAPPEGLGKPG